MSHLNVEIKAFIATEERFHEISGRVTSMVACWNEDHQIDTYYELPEGRLKVREGNVENFLVHYLRSDQEGPKKSDVALVPLVPHTGEQMKTMLVRLGYKHKVIVDKVRRISFFKNVKIHLDNVKNLGFFVEIEAQDFDGSIGEAKLNKQCQQMMDRLGIQQSELVSKSYSDFLEAM